MDIFASLTSNTVRLTAEPLVLRAESLRAEVTFYRLPDWVHIGVIRIRWLVQSRQHVLPVRVRWFIVSKCQVG
jgi:hypothetical protein